ncbi:MAG: glycosyltransferase [Saprospiraceae bacterium]|nr:glycosyltransferase [Candidatus Opimibacter skivensis]
MHPGKLSIILLAYQSEKRLEKAVTEIDTFLSAAGIPHEIVIIDDGSTDQSFATARELAQRMENISAYSLSRNYTSPMAQFAGLEMCTGQCACPMPDDGQRPIAHIIDMYRLWEKGHKIILGYREGRDDGRVNDFFSNGYYSFMNRFSEITFPPGGSDGYLIDREIIDLLNTRISKRNTTPVIELLKLGYSTVFVPYQRPQRAGKSRWTLRKKINLALNTFFASSIFPLRMITWLGLIIFCFSLLAILLIIAAKLFSDNTLFGFPIQGWTTLVVLMTMFNGILMLSIGVVSEYLWRIYEEVKQRPPYIIRDKHPS